MRTHFILVAEAPPFTPIIYILLSVQIISIIKVIDSRA